MRESDALRALCVNPGGDVCRAEAHSRSAISGPDGLWEFALAYEAHHSLFMQAEYFRHGALAQKFGGFTHVRPPRMLIIEGGRCAQSAIQNRKVDKLTSVFAPADVSQVVAPRFPKRVLGQE